MLKKLKAKEFTADQMSALQESAEKQEISRRAPKSTDPVNFPVFDIPVGKKVMVYVPNHTVADGDKVELRMDKPLIHAVQDGNRFLNFRCISGLPEEAGYSGMCPLCEGTSEPWDLAKEQIREACSRAGLSMDDSEDKSVKAIKSEYYGNRVIKEAQRKYTFPIVVIETVNDEGKTPVIEDGKLKYKVMWYTIGEQAYEDKWIAVLEGMEDEPSHPGGHIFILNYQYTPKTGEQNARDAARNLKVIPKNVKGFEKIAPMLDKATEDWTPAKAQQTVIMNQFYEEADLEEVTNTLIQPTRDLLAVYKAKASGLGAEAIESGFEMKALPEEEENIELPTLETDSDF